MVGLGQGGVVPWCILLLFPHPISSHGVAVVVVVVIANSNLGSVFLPTSLVIISDQAFEHCYVQTITIPT